MRAQAVTVRVPGSTSNLGSGFDTLGLAVRLYNRVRVGRTQRNEPQLVVRAQRGEPAKAAALVRQAVRLFFLKTATAPFRLNVTLSGEVPIGRGLGASATARVGVLMALNELAGTGLGREDLLELATELEGHPDNASPALFGGFTVSGRVGRKVRCLSFRVSRRLTLVTLLPRFEISTEAARKLVPSSFSKRDAAHSLNRAALIAAALAAGDPLQLRGLFDDCFHQPYRQALLPQLSRVLRAGERAGAIGGWLSGSGSAMICLAMDGVPDIATAMHRELPNADVKLLQAENAGARILV